MMLRLFRRVAKDERGVAIIEMALVAPVFALIVVGMIDLSNGYSRKLQLEQAAQRTIERAQQNFMSSSMRDTLKAEAAAAAGVDPDKVTVDSWLECGMTRAADYDTPCPPGESYARYLDVSIEGSYTPIFALGFAGAKNGVYVVTGKAGVRIQ